MTYQKPPHWGVGDNKLFKYQVGFTCPPIDWDAGPSDFLRMSPESVGVHGWMLHVPDYGHRLDQRKHNFGMMEEFVHCMANNGVVFGKSFRNPQSPLHVFEPILAI